MNINELKKKIKKAAKGKDIWLIKIDIVNYQTQYRLFFKGIKIKWALTNIIDKSKTYKITKIIDLEANISEYNSVIYFERLRLGCKNGKK